MVRVKRDGSFAPAPPQTSAKHQVVEIPARRLIKPYRQGELDALCGLYSALNALCLALYGCSTLSRPVVDYLFELGADYLDCKRGAGTAMASGVETRRWHALTRKLADRLSSPPFMVDVERAELGATPTMSDVFDWIATSITEEKPVLICFEGGIEHFSVVAGITASTLQLFDSDGHRFVRRSSCGIRSGFYRVSPKALLRIAVRRP